MNISQLCRRILSTSSLKVRVVSKLKQGAGRISGGLIKALRTIWTNESQLRRSCFRSLHMWQSRCIHQD